MSHTALQRVLVRLLYDPALLSRIHAAPEHALPNADLSPTERGWLLATDPRAFALDPLRRTRTLAALLDEYPASAALVGRDEGDSRGLDSWFSSGSFHAAIQERRALAPAVGAWLLARPESSVRLRAVAALELALATLRRPSPAPALGPQELVCAPTVGLARVATGTLALYGHLLGRLRAADPQLSAALWSPSLDLGDLPIIDPTTDEHLLLETSAAGGIDISELSPPLAELLRAAAAPIPRPALLARARALGADPGEDTELIAGLIDDHLLHTSRSTTP